MVPGDTRAQELHGPGFRLEHGRDGVAATLADHDHDLALAGLIAEQATVAAVLAIIGGLDVAAEIAAIHFRNLAFAADNAAPQFCRHCFAQLVEQHESALVGDVQIAGERQRRLALDLIAEDRNGREIAAQRQLVRGKQRPAGDA